METEVRSDRILIHFPNGIYGFEDVKDYVLLQEDDGKVIWSLQAADSAYPSLVVIDPFLVAHDYAPKLTAAQRKLLGDPAEDDLCWLAVAVIGKNPENWVVNLKSPIAISVKSHTGIQIILEDTRYPVRYPLFSKGGA